MTHESAEDALHTFARAVIAGDYRAGLQGMVPEALPRTLEALNWTVRSYLSYELVEREREGDDQLFSVRYETDLDPITLRYRFRNIDGAWKVVDVERVDEGPGA